MTDFEIKTDADWMRRSIEDHKIMMKFLCEDIAINQRIKEKTGNLDTIFVADCIIKDEADYISFLAEEIKYTRELLWKDKLK